MEQETYWARDLDVDPGHPDESLVEVLDGFGGILGRLVAHIANAAVREELDVCDGEFGEVLAHVILGELGRQPAHKDT